MNRFFRPTSATLLLTLALSACATPPPAADAADAPTRLPNIIYIMVDDLGYGDPGCYGQKVIRTPHIDRLARDGMRFTDHYAGHTVCRPSRLVLWTGQHTGHTAISGNSAHVFGPKDVTVAKLLKGAGYATGGVGKWAQGNTENTGHPNLSGFDFWMPRSSEFGPSRMRYLAATGPNAIWELRQHR